MKTFTKTLGDMIKIVYIFPNSRVLISPLINTKITIGVKQIVLEVFATAPYSSNPMDKQISLSIKILSFLE